MGAKVTIEQVAQADLFKNMSLDEVKELLSKTNMLVKHFHKNAYVFLAGDVVENLCVVVNGTVQIVKEDASGDRSIIGSIESGRTFGTCYLGSKGKHSVVSYFAVKNCEILMIPFASLNMNVIGNQNIYCKFFSNIIATVAGHNINLIEKVDVLGRKTLRGKIMAYLEKEAQLCRSRTFALPFNRTDLANYLDADRSAMTREIARMRDDGLIKFEKNIFTLVHNA